MRSILKPSDIFEMVGKIWSEQHSEQVASFASVRMEAEKKAGAIYGCFHYEQIYGIMEEMGVYSVEQLNELKELEYQTEQKLLSPRADMVKALEYAWDEGKKIYLISDMYFSGEQIKAFLEQYGITHYHGLLVSSDAGCTKWPEGALYKKAIEIFGINSVSVLHIGDNEAADVECSKKAGFDAYTIWSAYHMLEMSTLQRLLVNIKTLEDSCLLGIWMEYFLNSPFALHEKQGHLHIQSECEVGFAGFAAIITAFMHRLIKEHQGEKQEKILFLARDGYLLEKLYRTILLERNITDAPEGIYVLASRRALAIPAIETKDDLEQQLQRVRVEALAGEFLELRFGIKPETEDAEAELVLKEEELRNYIRKYTPQILARAKQERNDYLLYLESLGIDREKDIHILVDSQTSGTSVFIGENSYKKKLSWKRYCLERFRIGLCMIARKIKVF